ncbi:DUF5518 domain-containing protein [Natronobiforma cellulositropha]|uniref:DUF5518 domain-containing protein n=1 Tax=Natronobiforma cellulositropha TaxID=1679076 RepID=UPI0021D5DF70|nr:DUF5518 domain-containing protein [Natronobiforma cellulositropha]
MSDSQSSSLINALIGAVVTVLLSFTMISPVAGGAVAGYLERTDGVRIGAISGAIALVPMLFFGILVIGFLSMGNMAGFAFLFLLFMLVFGAIWTVGLSALGGYLGVYLRDEL